MRLSAQLVLSSPSGTALAPAMLDRALKALDECTVFDSGWLTPDRAWRALFSYEEGCDLLALRLKARAAFAGAAIDVNLLPDDLAFAQKRLVVADMESTLIAQEMIDETAREAGVWEPISRITAATMRGELPFEASLRERTGYFEGLPFAQLEALVPRMSFMPGAEALFRALKASGIKTAIVTGGFSLFAEIIGARLGVDHVIANRLDVADGRLTGRLLEPVIGVAGKEEALRRLAAAHDLDLSLTAAVGDGANDLGMLGAAGLGVAYRGKPKVREAMLASASGAILDYADLTGLLDLMALSRGGA